LKGFVEVAFIIFAMASGLMFMMDREVKQRPYDLLGAVVYFLVAVLTHIFWK
jgi:hypothetical protein